MPSTSVGQLFLPLGDIGKRSKGKDSRVGKKGPDPVVESPRPEGLEGSNPLLECMEEEQGRLFLPGNTTLVHLALACETHACRQTHVQFYC